MVYNIYLNQLIFLLYFLCVYIFTLELYPTLYRTTALSMCSAAARIGSLMSPLIAMLDVVHPVLPLGVYGAIVLSAGISSILLWPETLHRNFTERLEECERRVQPLEAKLRFQARKNK